MQAKTLLYTIAFDRPGENHFKTMAKLLVMSLLRTGFDGDIVVFTNSSYRLFEQGRERVEEININMESDDSRQMEILGKTFKFRARELLNLSSYDSVWFIDSDCLILRNPAQLISDQADIFYAEEEQSNVCGVWFRGYLPDALLKPSTPGINSGVWWMRTAVYEETMAQWEEIVAKPPLRDQMSVDQSAWVRLMLENRYVTRPLLGCARVFYPLLERRTAIDFDAATILHFAGPVPGEVKVQHVLSTFMRCCQPELAKAMIDFATLH